MVRMFDRNNNQSRDRDSDNRNAQENMHEQREAFDREHSLSNLSDEERKRMHDAYSEMGKVGGPIGGSKRAEQLGREGYQDMGHMGGVSRAEQMAKGKEKK